MTPRFSRSCWAPRRVDDVADGLVLFDGVCMLCSRSVQFVIGHDPTGRFRFVAIQTPYGSSLAQQFGINAEAPETNAAVVDGWAYFKSDSTIAVLACLPGWSWTRIFLIVPRSVRNWLYDLVARHRYRLFGRSAHCLMPTPEIARRFVGSDGPANK